MTLRKHGISPQFFTFKRVAGVLSIHVNLEQVPQHPPVSLTLFDLHSMRFLLASFWTQTPSNIFSLS